MTKQKESRWYILSVVSGQENRIASDIKLLFNAESVDTLDVLVPSKQVIKITKGRKVQEAQRLFPGYVFIYMNISDLEVCSKILSLPKVLGFLGPKNRPEPVPNDRIEEILKTCSGELLVNETASSIRAGDVVNVINGPFESFSGVVEEFDQEKQRVKISVLIFGRSTSVELEVDQIQKI